MQQDKFVKPRRDARGGVYIHVPFCARLCPYCDFAVTVKAEIPHRAYADALLAEFSARAEALDGRDVKTIYLGGGTPSLWDRGELRRVLDVVRARYGVSDDIEITLEANPNQIDTVALREWKAAGINRLSIGCQSFQPRMLKALRRNHSAQEAVQAVERALGAFEKVSLDVMFGGPGQTLEEWALDLAQLGRFEGLSHVSAYSLTVEPGTAFWIRQKRGTLQIAEEDVAAEMMEQLVEYLAGLGLERYEVSSFARPEARSAHNSNYWLGGEYLGLGVGAHSFGLGPGGGGAEVVRRNNPRKLDVYMAAPEKAAEVERLSAYDHLLERLFLGVRTAWGLDFEEIRHQFGGVIGEDVLGRARELLEEMVREGFLVGESVFRPTEPGFRFADTLAEKFYTAL